MPSSPLPASAAARSVWSYPGMFALAAVAFTGFAGYALLLPAAPLWVVEGGGATPRGAGAVNFVLLGATVATQFLVPGIIRRLDWGPTLALAMLLMGVPSLLSGFSADLTWTLGLSAVRGVGFGLLTVAASAVPVLLVPPARKGAAIGAYSLALSAPNVLLMPTGSWIADLWGFWPVFLIGGLPLLGIPACFVLARHLPRRSTSDDRPTEEPPPTGRVRARMVPPSLVLLSITLAGGAVITFAPQMVERPWLATAGLFALGLSATLTRWGLGGIVDRVGAPRVLWPFVVLAVLALAGMALILRHPVGPEAAPWWILACALVGCCYGGLQNVTMVLTFLAAGPRRVGAASAVWNVGYDTGTALGALLVGAVAHAAGFSAGMACTAALCAVMVPVALRLRGVRGGVSAARGR